MELTDQIQSRPVGIDPHLGESLQKILVLPVAHTAHRHLLGRVLRCSLGQLDPPRRQEVPNPVVSRLAVDMSQIVKPLVESGGIGPDLIEEGIKGLLPGPAVDRDRVGDHPVHVENHRPARPGVDQGLPTFDPEQRAQPFTPVAATPRTK